MKLEANRGDSALTVPLGPQREHERDKRGADGMSQRKRNSGLPTCSQDLRPDPEPYFFHDPISLSR